MAADLSDLIAIAFVRRTLMELGFQINPAVASIQAEVGVIEMWIHETRADLGAKSPLAVLREKGGEERIRSLLKHILACGACTA